MSRLHRIEIQAGLSKKFERQRLDPSCKRYFIPNLRATLEIFWLSSRPPFSKHRHARVISLYRMVEMDTKMTDVCIFVKEKEH